MLSNLLIGQTFKPVTGGVLQQGEILERAKGIEQTPPRTAKDLNIGS